VLDADDIASLLLASKAGQGDAEITANPLPGRDETNPQLGQKQASQRKNAVAKKGKAKKGKSSKTNREVEFDAEDFARSEDEEN
jgi:hypothetical protein